MEPAKEDSPLKSELSDELIQPVQEICAIAKQCAKLSKTCRKRCGSTSAGVKKKIKNNKLVESVLEVLKPEPQSSIDAREEAYALNYFQKVRATVTASQFQTFNSILDQLSLPGTDFRKMLGEVNTLFVSYPELAEDFIPFLTPEQALECGVFMQHLMLTKMSDFLYVLETHFAKTPYLTKRILAAIETLSLKNDVTLEEVTSAILPMLKGHPVLTDYFLQLLPDSRPPDYLRSDFHEVDEEALSDASEEGADSWERIEIPPAPDPYGGSHCICKCHDVEDDKFKSRSQHCLPCSIKFMNGKIFIHSGKQLRRASLTFANHDMEFHRRRLFPGLEEPRKRKRSSSYSPNKSGDGKSKTAKKAKEVKSEGRADKKKDVKDSPTDKKLVEHEVDSSGVAGDKISKCHDNLGKTLGEENKKEVQSLGEEKASEVIDALQCEDLLDLSEKLAENDEPNLGKLTEEKVQNSLAQSATDEILKERFLRDASLVIPAGGSIKVEEYKGDAKVVDEQEKTVEKVIREKSQKELSGVTMEPGIMQVSVIVVPSSSEEIDVRAGEPGAVVILEAKNLPQPGNSRTDTEHAHRYDLEPKGILDLTEIQSRPISDTKTEEQSSLQHTSKKTNEEPKEEPGVKEIERSERITTSDSDTQDIQKITDEEIKVEPRTPLSSSDTQTESGQPENKASSSVVDSEPPVSPHCPKTPAKKCLETDSCQTESKLKETAAWKIEEDKVILRTLQVEPYCEETFVKIKQSLTLRSVEQIKTRFQELLDILYKMKAESND